MPLSSMSPTILVSPDGKERIVVGASGGPLIITSTLQVILNIIDFELEPSQANSRGRIHHQWVPEKLFIDDELTNGYRKKHQKARGTISSMPASQVIHCIESDCYAASDPRKGWSTIGVILSVRYSFSSSSLMCAMISATS